MIRNGFCEVLACGGFAVAFILLFFAGEYLRRVRRWPPEVTRKFIHLVGCLIAMLFPVFLSFWSVLALCISFALLLLISQRINLLHAVNDVERSRDSMGGVAHPLAILGCFLWAGALHRMVFYEIAMLVLAISDSSAALTGTKYGQTKYQVEGNSRKSIEGSVVFSLTTFLIVEIMLLLCTDLTRIDCILVAVWVAILVTVFEAISLHGSDNLIIPLGTVFILWKNMSPSTPELIVQLAVLAITFIALAIMAFPYHKISILSGVFESGLVIYSAWGLLDLSWAIPVFAASWLLFRTDWFMRNPENKEDAPRVRTTFYYMIVPTVWFLSANLLWRLTEGGKPPLLDFSATIAEYLKGAPPKTLLFYPGFLVALVGQLFLSRQKVRADSGKPGSLPRRIADAVLLLAAFHLISLPIFWDPRFNDRGLPFHLDAWIDGGAFALLTVIVLAVLYRPLFGRLEALPRKWEPRLRMAFILLLSGFPVLAMFLRNGGKVFQ